MLAQLDSITTLQWILESAALLAGLLYIYCAYRRSDWSWLFGVVSALCIIIVDVRYTHLYFDAILHFFFLIMSFIGLFLWTKKQPARKNKDIRISSMGIKSYLGYIGLSLVITGAAGYLWSQQTDGAYPYLDCFQMMLSIFATFLIMYCVIQAWSYWILVDILSIALYVLTGAFLLAILYLAYLISNTYQWTRWQRMYTSGDQILTPLGLRSPP